MYPVSHIEYNYNHSPLPLHPALFSSAVLNFQKFDPPNLATDILPAQPSHGLKTLTKRSRSKSFGLRRYLRNVQEREESNELTSTFDRHGVLGKIISTLGLSGIVIPFLTLMSFPLQLLNPNLLIAKALTVLSIPVAFSSLLGRSFDEPLTWFGSSSFGSIGKSGPGGDPRGISVWNKRNATATPTKDLQERCLERIACEGVLQTIPQIFLKSILNGQVDLFWNYRGPDDSSNNPSSSNNNNATSTNDFQKGTTNSSTNSNATSAFTVTSRKKNLAKYALSRVKNKGSQFLNRIGNRVSNKNSSGNPSRDSTSTQENKKENLGCSKYRCSFML